MPSRADRGGDAAPVPFLPAVPAPGAEAPSPEILAERLRSYARAARGAFADATLRAMAVG